MPFQSDTPVTGVVVDPTTGVAIEADGVAVGEMELTAAQMEGAFMVRVQASQPGVDLERDEDGELVEPNVAVWKASNNASVTAKP